MQRASDPKEPELPARVPEERDAVTPDLPPVGPDAPDLRDTAEKDGSEPAEPAEEPAAEPGSAEAQEPTD
ncbi:hypothetical protein [Streptomyces sp. NPDC088762]|uniref:hypothetical protein n=1 Tax=Streptomyces sp. NPDC088762 TaxID=3365891 RepID=UPI0037F7321A